MTTAVPSSRMVAIRSKASVLEIPAESGQRDLRAARTPDQTSAPKVLGEVDVATTPSANVSRSLWSPTCSALVMSYAQLMAVDQRRRVAGRCRPNLVGLESRAMKLDRSSDQHDLAGACFSSGSRSSQMEPTSRPHEIDPQSAEAGFVEEHRYDHVVRCSGATLN